MLQKILKVRPQAWPAAPLAHHVGAALGNRNQPLEATLLTGSRILLNLSEYAHRQIFFYGAYEAPTTNLLRRIAFPGWTFLDVGANVGYYSFLAADLGGPDAKVIAFEPNSKCASMLMESIKLNGLQRISVATLACGAEEATAPFQVSSDPNNSGLSRVLSNEDGVESNDAEVVQVTALDLYCATTRISPDVVKIDVEGSEMEVVKGMNHLLSSRGPLYLVIELEGGSSRPQPVLVIDQMQQYGYRPRIIREDGSLERLDPPYRIFGTQNICFARIDVITDPFEDALEPLKEPDIGLTGGN